MSHSFQRNRSKVSKKTTINLIIGAMNNIFHIVYVVYDFVKNIKTNSFVMSIVTKAQEMCISLTSPNLQQIHMKM